MSSNDKTLGQNGANGDGDLRDPVLRRALDHAPDHDATPHPRTRDAILKMAHNLAPAAPSSAAANNASAAPWWRRLFGGGDTRSRMPWNAAFATVLVATFVGVLWHREPIPDARLDGEARVGGATAQAPAAAAPTPPAAEAVPQQAPGSANVAPQVPAPPAAEPPAAIARDSAREALAEQNTADAVRRSAPPPQAARKAAPAPAPEIDAKSSSPEPVLPAPAPPAPITAAPDAAEQALRARKSSETESAAREKRSTFAAGAPAPSAPSAAAPSVAEIDRSPPALATAPAAPSVPAPAATAPLRRELADSSPQAFPGQGQANAEASGNLRQAPAPRAAAAAKSARPQAGTPSFAALDRWTAFDFARTGPGVRHARGDIEGLAALVNTVARSATEADMPLAAPVEARLSLYERGTLIAVLEIAGDQVRWTPQSSGAASVGTPPAEALAALRALLTR